MLSFIIIFNRELPGDFNIKNIPGTGNRLDVILRSMLMVLNSNYYNYLNPQMIIVFEKFFMKPKTLFINASFKLNIENEFSAALFFKRLLKTGFESAGLPDGIVSEPLSFEDVVQSLKPTTILYYMHKNGRLLSNFLFKNVNTAFILGDCDGLTGEQERILEDYGVQKLSLGSVEYLTSQCVSLIQYYFYKNRV